MIPQGAVLIVDVSTHSRPKAAGLSPKARKKVIGVSTHSRPKAAGWQARISGKRLHKFQLTAARRRLAAQIDSVSSWMRFNSQPPEGGWIYF